MIINKTLTHVYYEKALQNPYRHPERSEGSRFKGLYPIREVIRQACLRKANYAEVAAPRRQAQDYQP